MNKFVFFILIGLMMVLFDTMASVISRAIQIEYSWFIFGSFFLYFLAGFLGCWLLSFSHGLLAGLVAGLSESTLGWAVSLWIGPKTIADPADITVLFAVLVIVVAMFMSSVIGAVGSAAALILKKLTRKEPI
jgi:hypothetical protein